MVKIEGIRTNLILSRKAYILLQVYALREGKEKSEVVSRILEEEIEKRLTDIDRQFAQKLLSQAGSAGSPEGGS